MLEGFPARFGDRVDTVITERLQLEHGNLTRVYPGAGFIRSEATGEVLIAFSPAGTPLGLAVKSLINASPQVTNWLTNAPRGLADVALDGLGTDDSRTATDQGALDEFDAQLTGMRIREVRERKGLSLREVARRMDISASALSQIERGLLRPSVNRLFAIAGALDVTVLEVFGDGDATDEVATEESLDMTAAQSYSLRRSLEMESVKLDGGVSYRRLSPGRTNGIDFFESTYPPHSTAGDMHELNTHTGFEVGTIVSGELTIDFPKERVVLRAGDSISYSCALPHRLSNQSDEPAVATWLVVTRT